MTKISIIQFNGSNAFEISSGGYITTFPMRAVGFENIAFATQVFASSPGARLRATLREIGATGNLLSKQVKIYHLREINLWQRMETFWPAHADMAKAEVRLEALGGTVLIAQPKVSNGKVTGPYATNFAPQLSKISPTGIYTGTLVANQIIMSETETLDQSLTSIRAGFAAFVKRDDLGNPGKTIIDGANLKTGRISSVNNKSYWDIDSDTFNLGDKFTYSPADGLKLNGQFSATQGTRQALVRNGQYMIYNDGKEMLNISNFLRDGNYSAIIAGSGSESLRIMKSEAEGVFNYTYVDFGNRQSRFYQPVRFDAAVTFAADINLTGSRISNVSQLGHFTLTEFPSGAKGIKYENMQILFERDKINILKDGILVQTLGG